MTFTSVVCQARYTADFSTSDSHRPDITDTNPTVAWGCVGGLRDHRSHLFIVCVCVTVGCRVDSSNPRMLEPSDRYRRCESDGCHYRRVLRCVCRVDVETRIRGSYVIIATVGFSSDLYRIDGCVFEKRRFKDWRY